LSKENEGTYTNVLGQGTSLKGDIRFEENVLINGKVEGTITVKGALVIGETAEVKASVSATNLQIFGAVDGNIVCEGLLFIAHSAHIKGDIRTTLMSMEEGGILNGKVTIQKHGDQIEMLAPAGTDTKK